MARDTLLKILDLARWAPSGDNTQPWRFAIGADGSLTVLGHDTRKEILYDFEGHASHMAHGALLETLHIAASAFGYAAQVSIESAPPDDAPRYRVRFAASAEGPHPLLPFVEQRAVQRRPMRTTPLTPAQRNALTAAAGPDARLRVFEGFAARARVARLLWDNARIRLTCPEAYPVHKSIIEWGARYSKDRIPEQAVGVDPLTARLMQWVMGSWSRVEFFNRYLMGTVLPRVQLDVLPALGCAAHILLSPARPPQSLADWVSLGRAMQRIWLTAAQQGLHLQPQMTPVIFRWYAQAGQRFSASPGLHEQARALAAKLEALAGASPGDPMGFFARVGVCAAPRSRSTRLEVRDLLVDDAP
ncbi:MAG: nitroreductase family protein [Azonexus sp.]|nr:nitroreductase family protein [Azonexus sp.]MBP6905454.1 nitroreductase family protein [Azonexus sp.]